MTIDTKSKIKELKITVSWKLNWEKTAARDLLFYKTKSIGEKALIYIHIERQMYAIFLGSNLYYLCLLTREFHFKEPILQKHS